MEGITSITGGVSTPSLTEQAFGAKASQEEFLNLLVTQLRNQDPLEPIKNEDFLTQLATFSQLEEQQKTSNAIQNLIALESAGLVLGGLSQGAALVGRDVTYVDPDSNQLTNGLVERVTFDPSGVLLSIGGRSVPVGNVVSVSSVQAGGSVAAGTPAGNQQAVAQGADEGDEITV